MLPALANSLVDSLTYEITRKVVRALGNKYSIDVEDVKYILNQNIQDEFQRCLGVAIRSFIGFLSKGLADEKPDEKPDEKRMQSAVLYYLKSPSVSEEIWHLLEPGSEYFDRGKLAQDGYALMSKDFENIEAILIFDAWEEFLKAFSFASRSTPHFREFLRASYEAGSFKALSNIEDVLDSMDATIKAIHSEESIARKSIQDYVEELKVYKAWATEFQSI